jgi:hypothetical protein
MFYKCERSSPHCYTSRGIIVSRIYLNQLKKNEMSRACGTCGRQERCIQGSGGES